MPDILYESGPSGYSLTTGGSSGHQGRQGRGGPDIFGGGLDLSTIMNYALNRAESKARREEALFKEGQFDRARARRLEEADRSSAEAAQARAERERLRDKQLAYRKSQERQPMKLVTVGNQTFYTPETQGLTFEQRQKFLPQNSQMTTGPEEARYNAARTRMLEGAELSGFGDESRNKFDMMMEGPNVGAMSALTPQESAARFRRAGQSGPQKRYAGYGSGMNAYYGR